MKKLLEKPELNVEKLEVEDIMNASGGQKDPDEGEEDEF